MLGYVMIDFMMNDDLVTVVEVLRTLKLISHILFV